MKREKQGIILPNDDKDGVNRRGFLRCMACAGTGALWVTKGGILKSYSLSAPANSKGGAMGAR